MDGDGFDFDRGYSNREVKEKKEGKRKMRKRYR
jgi:hypothetical protein